MAKASTKSGPGSGRLSGLGDSVRKAGRSAPRLRSAGRRRHRSSLYGTARGLVFRRETIGVALVVAALVAIPWLVPITTGLSDIRDGVVQALGLHVFLLIALIALVGWLILRRSLVLSFQYYWRVWLAGLLLAAFADGLLGLIRPGWRLGGTTLSEVTAGGDWGHALVGSPVGVLVWLALAVATVSVIWPRRTLEAVRRSPRLAVVVWRWRLPQRTWRLLHVIVEALFPTKAEPEPPQPLSTETLTWARTAGTATDETTAPAGAAGEGGEAAAAVEEPWQPTLPLEMAPAREEEQPTPPWGPSGEGWQTPSLDVLVAAGPEASERPDNAARARLIVDTLSSFGVDSEVVQINEGPTVTQFGVEPGWEVKTRTVQERDSAGRPVFDRNGHPKIKTEEVSRTRVRVNQITSLANDLSLALATPSIRIEAPVPGKPVVGIEVPNVTTSLVTLRSVIESTAFQRLAARSKLTLALGKSVSGEPVVARSRQDAPSADRRRYRQRQERLHQLDHHLSADARHARRGALRHDRPQAGGAGSFRPNPAPGLLLHRHRRGQGGGDAAGGHPRDGEPLPALRLAGGAQHRGVQPPSRAPRAGCPTGWSLSMSWPT